MKAVSEDDFFSIQTAGEGQHRELNNGKGSAISWSIGRHGNGTPYDSSAELDHDDYVWGHQEIYTRISPFKSAREGTIIHRYEYFAELYAQYLTTGRVEFNKGLPQKDKYSSKVTKWMKGYFNLLKGMYGLYEDSEN